MIEIWMLFNLLIPFIEVVLHTCRYSLLQERREEKETSNDRNKFQVASTKNSAEELGMFKNNIMPMNMELKIKLNRLYIFKSFHMLLFLYSISTHFNICIYYIYFFIERNQMRNQ